jgi:ATP-dependent exoDNAse (exonuclease V), alpha subunit - helicase superfamily I member
MLQRNLLYTAVTRSKELLILLGEMPAYQRSVEQESNLRLTTLKERILNIDGMSSEMRERLHAFEEAGEAPFEPVEEVVTKPEKPVQEVQVLPEVATQQPSLFEGTTPVEEALPEYLTEEVVLSGQIDPMIGMGQTTPYDFQ